MIALTPITLKLIYIELCFEWLLAKMQTLIKRIPSFVSFIKFEIMDMTCIS